ncbi:MAG: hypothetical protein ACYSWP_00715 [Planctomycetota bacterium]|jgi:hypothetical protein
MNIEHKLLRKRIWSRPWFIVLSVLVLIVALFVFYRLSQKSALNKKLDEIRAAGYPATCEELDQWYSIPEDVNNAADTILDAIASFQQWPQQDMEDLPFVGNADIPKRTESMTEPLKEIIAEYLIDNEKALELLHKASQIEHSRYPADLTVGFNVLMPHLSDLRQSAKFLALVALLHAQNNQSNSAIDSIDAGFGVARSIEKEPYLISQLVRFACQALTVQSLEHAVNRIEFSDEQLKRLSQILKDAKTSDGMLYGFVGERCLCMDVFAQSTVQKLQYIHFSAPAWPLIWLYTAIGMADQDAGIYLDIMTKYVEAYKLSPIERLKVAKALEDEAEKISKLHFMTRTFIPAISRITELDFRIIALLDAARVAIVVEQYRLANGKLPDILDDLVPNFIESVPIDPFDGKPLKYKILDPGFVIYSIGEDLGDDGGKERGPDRKKPNDVTFIIER